MSDPFTLKLHPRGPPHVIECASFTAQAGFREIVFSLKVTNSSFPLPFHRCGKLRHASLPLGFSDMRARFPTIRLLLFLCSSLPALSPPGFSPLALQRPRQRKIAVMSAADRRLRYAHRLPGFLLKNLAVAFGILRESHLTFFKGETKWQLHRKNQQ